MVGNSGQVNTAGCEDEINNNDRETVNEKRGQKMNTFERALGILEHGEEVGNGSYEMAKQLLVVGVVSTDDTAVEFEVQRLTDGEWVPVSRADNERGGFKEFDAELANSPDSVLRLVRQTRTVHEIATTHNDNNDDEE